jgi:hypothetical protein
MLQAKKSVMPLHSLILGLTAQDFKVFISMQHQSLSLFSLAIKIIPARIRSEIRNTGK